VEECFAVFVCRYHDGTGRSDFAESRSDASIKTFYTRGSPNISHRILHGRHWLLSAVSVSVAISISILAVVVEELFTKFDLLMRLDNVEGTCDNSSECS
jgi:hypothetical protein